MTTDDPARPPRVFVEPSRMAVRGAAWTGVALVSAGPSFLLGISEYDPIGMFAGIAVWIVLLTLATSTVVFERFERIRGVRRTLRIGYGLRLLASIIFPVGWFMDLYAGVASITIAEAFGVAGRGLGPSLLITVIQGGVLNLVVGLSMLVLYPMVRPFTREAWDGVHRCRDCGYDLRGSDGSRCPECGVEVAAA